MYLSIRRRFGRWDQRWPVYRDFVGLPDLQEVRTVDPNLNEELETFEPKLLMSTKELNSAVSDLRAVGHDVYYQLATKYSEAGQIETDSRFNLLGFDLTESGVISGTSSLLNCGGYRKDKSPFTPKPTQFRVSNTGSADAEPLLFSAILR